MEPENDGFQKEHPFPRADGGGNFQVLGNLTSFLIVSASIACNWAFFHGLSWWFDSGY